jgi:MoxR-like ATPase
MVIATQNPIEQAGTYRLPEAQLDRFLMKSALGYPDRSATVELLVNAKVRDRAALVSPVITSTTIAQMSGLADDVYVDPAVISYVAELAEESRRQPHVRLGLSARGCLAMIRVAKTWAAAEGRNHVLPDDIKELAQPVLCHRLLLDAEAQFSGVTVEDVIGRLLDSVSPPTDRVE